jgi:hypothetical protein
MVVVAGAERKKVRPHPLLYVGLPRKFFLGCVR